jgi:hypothetical protein
MIYKQSRKANSLVLSVLTATLLLMLLLMAVGCVTKKELVYKKIYFADTNGVTTTIYYPKSFEKDLKTPHNDERWKYFAAKDAPDNGVAKVMEK